MKKQSILNGRDGFFSLLVASHLVFAAGAAYANPQGLTVVSGSAHTAQQGSTLQITTSQDASLHWNSFNIAAGETTVFQQPSATSIVLNNIQNANPSSIFGSLHANGIVILQNQNGFYFGPNAFVSANGLVLTTAAINPWASAGGMGWSFNGPPPTVPIVNYGHLETASGGSLFLIAKQIENHGTIEAPGGTVALVAGQQVLLSERADGLSLSAPVQLPSGSVDNQGRIVADAGQVLLQAQTVNNSGVIQANSVREQNGVIELYASQDIQLAGSSVIQANGGVDGISQGGNIVIKSGGTFSDNTGSQIMATGGANGGNGGNVEVSAPSVLSLNSSLDASAQSGFTGGKLFLDPQFIILSAGGSTATSGTVSEGAAPATGTFTLGPNTLNSFSQILLQASKDITLASSWTVPDAASATTLTLQAGRNIIFDNGDSLLVGENWSVNLIAGANANSFNTPTIITSTTFSSSSVTSGTGTITLNGSASVKTANGDINVFAGNSVTVGSGGIVTGVVPVTEMVNNVSTLVNAFTGTGGNVTVQATSGNVNCGTSTAGYNFTQTGVGYIVDPNLGGISTASGGNVFIQAGGNIKAEMPTASTVTEDPGSGAFGVAPGNVTLIAGAEGTVTGHYVLANGSGSISVANAGTSSVGLALSLIEGGWVVNATDNIFLQEVRNPNGMLNSQIHVGRTTILNPFQFLFNYDPLAYVVLNAGQGVTIAGSGPRTSSNKGEGLIFPPNLTIDAGPGGITLESPVSLFPSPEGELVMTTTGGGNLTGSGVFISDSTTAQWNSRTDPFGTPANDALHLNDPDPVLINISGSISDFSLYSPKSVEMYAGLNIVDSSAQIQNLHPGDTTTISAGGEILDHADYVIVALPPGQNPNFQALDQIADGNIPGPGGQLIQNPNLNPVLEGQQNQFNYDAVTRSLRYLGVMSFAVEQALLGMKTPFLNAATIQSIYNQSQLETMNSVASFSVGGPGVFRVNAASIDLGNGGGLVSTGIAENSALVPYTSRGADIDVSTSGNLSMVASTIESAYGGNINIRCGGEIDVGSALVPAASDLVTLGIITLWSGNINVIAAGNINVDGSRIAAYDGGNVFVESLNGNVNAGTGGNGGVLVNKVYVNKQGGLSQLSDDIPGSGILATSFPELVYGQISGHIGDITVETPQGDIEASRGGIVQLALGPGAANDATINLVAGSKNSDGSVAYVGNVDASGSGVVGGQVNISATGSINGLVVASVGANVTALQNVNATVLSQGGATVSAGGTVSGTIVGVGSVSVSGASDVAAAFSASGVSASGAVSGAAAATAPTGSSSASAAATTQQVNQSTQANSDVAANGDADDNDLLKKKKKSQLMEYVGRVRVLLPD